ncbi:MAG: hypothetical protein O3B86_10035, partial [Planctomycetota bacterium]|nr:hypothetical protein [Planctomycetota bacterium]
ELARQVANQSARLEQQVDWLHRVLYGRPASAREKSTMAAAFSELVASELLEVEATDEKDHAAVSLLAWQHITHTMLCSNEFIHLR